MPVMSSEVMAGAGAGQTGGQGPNMAGTPDGWGELRGQAD